MNTVKITTLSKTNENQTSGSRAQSFKLSKAVLNKPGCSALSNLV
jgi:hypothetical protein